MVTFSISKATFSDGTEIGFSAGDIIVFVGPNNAGKSVALREIVSSLKRYQNSVVVKEIAIEKEGEQDALRDHLDQNFVNDQEPQLPFTSFKGGELFKTLWARWSAADATLEQATRFFVLNLQTETRLKDADPAPTIRLGNQPPAHPIHHLALDPVLEKTVSNAFNRAFGLDLIVHRNAGESFPLYVAHRPVPDAEQGEGELSVSYFQKINLLPQLANQGDGMRAFAGVLMHSLLAKQLVVLIDEPEAFLHPPQARLLGQMLARQIKETGQLFLATHSGDFLRGLLDVPEAKVRVIRLRREKIAGDIEVNVTRELQPDDVRTVWNDPLLRYSNALDGLFHELVVVCEGDTDCRFYGAIVDAMYENEPEARRPDLMFSHCGGKHRIPMMVRALRALEVPVKAIVDFDALKERELLRRLCEALGGNWTDEMEANWRVATEAIQQKRPELETDEVRHEIGAILESIPDRIFPATADKNIKGVLRRASPWSLAKEHGVDTISGNPHTACKNLLDELETRGLHVVRAGELECFDRDFRSTAIHGPAWVNAVLNKRDLGTSPELLEARRFIERVVS